MARKGLPKAIIKKYGITKKAWQVYRGRKKKSSSRRKSNPIRRTRRKSNPSRGGRTMAKRSMKIPLAIVGGIAASPAIQGAAGRLMEGNIPAMIQHLGRLVGVYNGNFSWKRLVDNMGPIVLGGLIHKFVGGKPLNMNRYLRSIPFISI